MGNRQRNQSKQPDAASGSGRSAQQNQNSRQSMANSAASGGKPGDGGAQQSSPRQPGQQPQSGMGSSQRQDKGSPNLDRSSGGQSDGSDIERGGQGSSRDSLVNDPTGAFKERP